MAPILDSVLAIVAAGLDAPFITGTDADVLLAALSLRTSTTDAG